jgi:hypothetical protein
VSAGGEERLEAHLIDPEGRGRSASRFHRVKQRLEGGESGTYFS